MTIVLSSSISGLGREMPSLPTVTGDTAPRCSCTRLALCGGWDTQEGQARTPPPHQPWVTGQARQGGTPSTGRALSEPERRPNVYAMTSTVTLWPHSATFTESGGRSAELPKKGCRFRSCSTNY